MFDFGADEMAFNELQRFILLYYFMKT